MHTSAAKQTSWMVKYLTSLSLRNFTASGAKRVAVVGTEYVLVRLLVPSALSSSVMYLATSTAGTIGKNAISYGFTAATGGHSEIMMAIPKEDLALLQAEIKKDSQWHFNLSSIASNIKTTAQSKAVGACHSVLNLSYQELSQGTGALIGSTAATAGFLYFLGPPSLIALPFYLLGEGCAKSICAFLGKQIGRYYIGPKAIKPAIKCVWLALMGQNTRAVHSAIHGLELELVLIDLNQEIEWDRQNQSDPQMESLLSDWNHLSLAEKPEDLPKPPIIHHYKIELFEDYVGANDQQEPSATQELIQLKGP